jgi:hypothetical protein
MDVQLRRLALLSADLLARACLEVQVFGVDLLSVLVRVYDSLAIGLKLEFSLRRASNAARAKAIN